MSSDYYKQLPCETIDVLEAFMKRENIPSVPRFNITQALKYLCRCGLKPENNWKLDVQKALDYLSRSLNNKWTTRSNKK